METIKDNPEDKGEDKEIIKGRGGKRVGAGRPVMQDHQERAVTKSITLTVREWEILKAHSRSGSYSKAVAAALNLALDRKDWSGDWK